MMRAAFGVRAMPSARAILTFGPRFIVLSLIVVVVRPGMTLATPGPDWKPMTSGASFRAGDRHAQVPARSGGQRRPLELSHHRCGGRPRMRGLPRAGDSRRKHRAGLGLLCPRG